MIINTGEESEYLLRKLTGRHLFSAVLPLTIHTRSRQCQHAEVNYEFWQMIIQADVFSGRAKLFRFQKSYRNKLIEISNTKYFLSKYRNQGKFREDIHEIFT